MSHLYLSAEQRKKAERRIEAKLAILAAWVDFPAAWLVMIAFGIIHGEFAPSFKPIGFWPSYGLVVAFTTLTGAALFVVTYWLRQLWRDR